MPLGPRAPRAAPPAVHGRAPMHLEAEGPLYAGTARVALELPAGARLAGYPGRRRSSGGGPLYVRALALEAGNVLQLIVALEALLIPGELEEAVLARAKLPPQTCLLFAATHTHSGAGGTWKNALAEWAGNAPYDAAVHEAVVAATATAIGRALANLGPAQLSWRQAQWPGSPARVRGGGVLDDELTALSLVRPGGAPIATVLDFAMHPTMEPRSSTQLSGDWPALAAQRLEQHSAAVALILQGASGNATWDRDQSGIASVATNFANFSRSLFEGTRAGVPAGAPAPLAAGESGLARARLSCEVRIASLPPAQAGAAVPLLLRRGASNLLALFSEPWAIETTLGIDDLLLVGVPGEPVGALAQAVRTRRPHAAIVGLADGYAGYIEEPAGTAEPLRSYHGPGLAESLGLWPGR